MNKQSTHCILQVTHAGNNGYSLIDNKDILLELEIRTTE